MKFTSLLVMFFAVSFAHAGGLPLVKCRVQNGELGFPHIVRAKTIQANGLSMERFYGLVSTFDLTLVEWTTDRLEDEIFVGNQARLAIERKWPHFSPVAKRTALNYFLLVARDFSFDFLISPELLIDVLKRDQVHETGRLNYLLGHALAITHNAQHADGMLKSMDALDGALMYAGLFHAWSRMLDEPVFSGSNSQAKVDRLAQFLVQTPEAVDLQKEVDISSELAELGGFVLVPVRNSSGELESVRWVSREEAAALLASMPEPQGNIGF